MIKDSERFFAETPCNAPAPSLICHHYVGANDMGAVVADDPEIIFRDVPTVFADGLRFAIRHERADICEGADECAAEKCGAGAPFVCTRGGAMGGCSADATLWPKSSACDACCNAAGCTHVLGARVVM